MVIVGGPDHNAAVVVNQARSLLEGIEPADVASVERHRQAVELVDEIEHLDIVQQDSRARITAAVAASGTTLTEIFGIGPIVACMLIGYSGDPTRFSTASRYAAYTGTAPIRVLLRRPRHPSVVTARQPTAEPRPALRGDHPDPSPPQPGRGYYDRKLADGKTPPEAIRSLKRRLSDVVWRHLVADARRATS